MAAYEEQEYKKPFQMKVWAKMFPFFKPYRKYLLFRIRCRESECLQRLMWE